MLCRQQRRSCLILLVAVACCVPLATSDAAKLPPIPSATCRLIEPEAAPKIDGVLDEQIWSQTQSYSGFLHPDRSPAEPATEFRLLCDGTWLYVGVVCHEPEMDKLVAKRTGPDANRIWADDCIELFIAPVQAEPRYFHLIANTIGATYDAMGKGGPVDFNADWRTACKRYKDRWTLEIAVKLSSVFMEPPSIGDAIDFNIGRERLSESLSTWSFTGGSFHVRPRFGEVVFGTFDDRWTIVRKKLQETLDASRQRIAKAEEDYREAFAEVDRQTVDFLAATPEAIDARKWCALNQTADSLHYRLRHAVLADRKVIVWSCNPMRVPVRQDLPSVDVVSAKQLDVRVLADEWESAALVVSNLTTETLDAQVFLSDLTKADGKTKVKGWDVIQVRTAPHYYLSSGLQIRDPLVDLPRGDLLRAAPGENELLWLTFKSKGLAPGRYSGTLTVRALDDSVNHDVRVAFRVYPLALGAKGYPRVMTWNYLNSGPLDQMLENARDYYLNVCWVTSWDAIPYFTTS